jgi:hypothetical protein
MITSSCKKTSNVSFHGQFTFDCNNQPVKNLLIQVFQVYNTSGSLNMTYLGSTATDNNGYYSMVGEVSDNGSFNYYSLYISSGDSSPFINNATEYKIYQNKKTIEMSFQVKPRNAFSFHIKNTTPLNNSDMFNSLTLTSSQGYQTLISNLAGVNIDTTVYVFHDVNSFYFNYSVTKNNILSQLPNDSLIQANCLDTLKININY